MVNLRSSAFADAEILFFCHLQLPLSSLSFILENLQHCAVVVAVTIIPEKLLAELTFPV
jgi:hypothetical protein